MRRVRPQMPPPPTAIEGSRPVLVLVLGFQAVDRGLEPQAPGKPPRRAAGPFFVLEVNQALGLLHLIAHWITLLMMAPRWAE